jgi:hypothetical protein
MHGVLQGSGQLEAAGLDIDFHVSAPFPSVISRPILRATNVPKNQKMKLPRFEKT